MEIIETNLQFNSNNSPMKKVEGIALHHSGVSVLQSVEVIHNYHKSKGWAGIGYHYYVRKDGSVYRGRPENMAGAHCPGVNSTSIGICAEGNFSEETMSDVQKQAIIKLVKYIKSRYDIKWVKGHREIISTDCPGDNFPLEEIKNVIANVETPQITNSIEDLAQKVIAGEYGNGEERKQKLGSSYDGVQRRVNEILLGKGSSTNTNEELAKEVIEGNWGNNPERKQKLLEAGYDYDAIQKLVNQKLK